MNEWKMSRLARPAKGIQKFMVWYYFRQYIIDPCLQYLLEIGDYFLYISANVYWFLPYKTVSFNLSILHSLIGFHRFKSFVDPFIYICLCFVPLIIFLLHHLYCDRHILRFLSLMLHLQFKHHVSPLLLLMNKKGKSDSLKRWLLRLHKMWKIKTNLILVFGQNIGLLFFFIQSELYPRWPPVCRALTSHGDRAIILSLFKCLYIWLYINRKGSMHNFILEILFWACSCANGYIITSLFFSLYSIWLFDFWTLNLVCLVIAAHLLDLLMLIFCCQSGLIVIGLLLISIICMGVGACDAVTGRGQGSFFCGVGAGHLDTAPPSCLPYFLSKWFT